MVTRVIVFETRERNDSYPERVTADGPRVLVVVPALNEEAAVGGVVREIADALPGSDVLVVDDGSTDRTAAVARAAGARVVELPFNIGVGGAMRTGFRYALDQGYDAVVQVDADGQHDPRHIPVLLAALDRADVVIGARFAGVGAYVARGPRRWAMRILALVVSRMAHTRLTDVTSGFRVSNRKAIERFARHYPAEYLGDTVESLVIGLRTGCTVTQVPVVMRARASGVPSHAPFRSALYLFRACFALGLALVRRWDAGLPEDVVQELKHRAAL